MSEDIATLGIKIDASSVDTGTAKLNDLTKAGAAAEAQTGKLGKATDVLTASVKAGGSATAEMIQNVGGWTKAQTIIEQALKDTATTATATAKVQAAAIKETAAAHEVLNAASAATAGHVATNSRAITESLVILREAFRGNFTRMAGSASILVGALGVSAAAIAVVAGTVALIVGPFVLAQAAIDKYNAKQREFTDLANGVGAAIGLTAKQINDAAESGAASQKISLALAEDFATVYAKTGKIGGDVLATLTENTLKFANATGQSAEEASKQLATAFSDPAKGAKSLNDQLALLNATQLDRITQLADEGHLTQAQAELADALTARIKDQSTEVGVLKKAWESASTSVSDYFDRLGKFLSGDTVTRLATAQAHLVELQKLQSSGVNLSGASQYQDDLARTTKLVADLTDKINTDTAAQKANDAQAKANAASSKAGSLAGSILPDTKVLDDLKAKSAVLFAGITAGAGDSAQKLDVMQHAYRAVQDAIGRVTDAEGKYIPLADREHQIAVLQAQEAGTRDQKTKGEIATKIALLKVGADLITNQEAQTKATDAGNIVADKVSKTGQGQIENAEKLLQSSSDQLKAQTALNDAVQSGAISVQKQAEEIKVDTQLKNLNAEAELASGEAKRKLMAIAAQLRPVLIALYSANETAQLLKQNAATADGNRLLQVQIANVGKSNIQQAQALAIAREMQRLKGTGQQNTAAGKEAIELAKEQATLNVELAQTQSAYNDMLTRTSDLYSELNTQVENFAQAVGTGFGTAATALSNLASSMTDYYAKQTKLDADYQKQKDAGFKDDKARVQAQDDYTRKSTELQLSADADVLSSAASAFGQKTTIYKLLQGASLALRAVEAITAIQSILNDTTTTASSVAASGAKATASGVEAQAKALAAAPPPYNLILEAITVAALIAAGVSLIGGGGGSAAATDNGQASQSVQDAQGTGTVFGDATGKSQSLVNSLDLLTKDQNTSLSYFNEMVISLKAIQNSIGSLTGLLSQQLSISSSGGLFDTSGLNISQGGGTDKQLTDQGLNFRTGNLADIIKNGVKGAVYDTILYGKSGNGGDQFFTFYPNNNSNGQAKGGEQFSKEVGQVLGSIEGQVASEAAALGVKGAKALLDSMQISLGKVSLKGLSGSALTDALNAVFSKAGDQMATKVLPMVKSFQQAGEGALDTLSRLVDEYQVTQQVFKEVGNAYDVQGVKSLQARDNIVKLSGGLDNFTQQASDFSNEFLTSAQQIAPIQKAVTAELDKLNLGWIKTKAQFVSVVDGLDLTTAHGQKLYAELMAVAGGFGAVVDAADKLKSSRQADEITILQDQGKAQAALNIQRKIELATLDKALIPLQKQIYAYEDLAAAQQKLTTAQDNAKSAEIAVLQIQLGDANKKLTNSQKAVSNATNDLTNAYNVQAGALQNTVSNFKGFASTLAQFKQSLTTGQSNGNILQDYATDKATFQATAVLAARGNQTALGNFATVAQNFLTASQAASPTSAAYAADLAAVIKATDAAQAEANKRANNAEKQLNALNSAVKGLIQINTSIGQGTAAITGVGSQVEKLQAAQAAEAAAQAAANKIQQDLNKANGQLGLKAAQAALTAAQAALIAAQASVGRATTATERLKLLADVQKEANKTGNKSQVSGQVVDDAFKLLLGRGATVGEEFFFAGLSDGKLKTLLDLIKSTDEYKSEHQPKPHHSNVTRRGPGGHDSANENGEMLALLRDIKHLLEDMDNDGEADLKLTREMRDLFKKVTQGNPYILTQVAS